jgi:miniconductance mechanosensitive channel
MQFMIFLQQMPMVGQLVEKLPESMQTPYTEPVIELTMLLLVAITVHVIIRVWIIRLLHKLDERTESEWYASFLKHKLPQRALFMVPLVIFYNGLILIPSIHEEFTDFILRITAATMILVGARVLDALLSSVHTIYLMLPRANKTPIKSYIQLGKVLIYVLAGFFIISSLADKSPWFFISGLGAITAILMLVFRDTLLSLVASIQLTNNDLIRVGDWIEMPQFGADGDVIDIALNTVRVQNFDKTITVIPTHKFLEHSFRNWRGMSEAGGRRIMRSLNVDLNTIRFLSYPEIQKLSRSHLLSDYIKRKMEEVNEYNSKYLKEDTSTTTNGRWLTNIGTFRAYVIEYLKNHPNSRKNMTMLVRQLEATEKGLPLQIYLFTNTTVWAEYEGIQADIFDHLIAVASEFGLRIYQQPSGQDLAQLQISKQN